MKLSIVIPVYNEGENILSTLEEINKIKKQAEITILICYDFDDDNTLSSINNSKFKDILNIIYVKSTEVSGPHAAVMTGINYKKQFDYTIILPADDDYNIKNFPKVFEIMRKESPEIIVAYSSISAACRAFSLSNSNIVKLVSGDNLWISSATLIPIAPAPEIVTFSAVVSEWPKAINVLLIWSVGQAR